MICKYTNVTLENVQVAVVTQKANPTLVSCFNPSTRYQCAMIRKYSDVTLENI